MPRRTNQRGVGSRREDDFPGPCHPWEQGFHPTAETFRRHLDPDSVLPPDLLDRAVREARRAYLRQRSRAGATRALRYTAEELADLTEPARHGLEQRFRRLAAATGEHLDEPEITRRAAILRREFYRDLSRAGNAKRWGASQ